jgi:predicted deacetylase
MSITSTRSAETERPALLSVHDVAPENLGFLADLLRDLADRHVPAVNVAVVPSFHGASMWTADAIGRALADVPAGMRTEILLHGCFHARVGGNARLAGWRLLRSRLQSAGEDEFFCLDPHEAEDRIRQGRRIIETAFGAAPGVFLPPAWTGGRALRDVLGRLGFSATEDHFWLYDLRRRRRLASPVIAFATRSAWRARISTLWARAIIRTAASGAILRFAFHPADYSSPAIRSFALGLVEELSRTREWGLYNEALGSGNGWGQDMIRPISTAPGSAPRADGS